jgi:hypothetical protein
VGLASCNIMLCYHLDPCKAAALRSTVIDYGCPQTGFHPWRQRISLRLDVALISALTQQEARDQIIRESARSNLLTRLFVAAIGKAFLIGPMWLMMIDTGFYTALVATTLFVAAFGFMMACIFDKKTS